MRKNKAPIEVIAVVQVGDKLYNLDEMTPEQKKFVGTHIRLNLLNGAYAGKAEFYAPNLPPVEEVFPEYRKST